VRKRERERERQRERDSVVSRLETSEKAIMSMQ
jgi:hypothetical protein